jgi:selenide,water dikinase
VRVLTDARTVVPEYSAAVRGRLARLAQRRNIGLHGGSPVTEVGPGYVRVKDAVEFATDATFWVAGAAAPGFLRDSGLATDGRGFLAVNDFLQSTSHPEIFGAGDCATNLASPRAKAGVFAVRAGPALAANLLAALKGGVLERHVPSARFLALVSCGARYAVGVYGPVSFEGRWAWRWKDRIDRRFVSRYSAPATESAAAR